MAPPAFHVHLILLIANAFILSAFLKLFVKISDLSDPLGGTRNYTYVGDDYPLELPLEKKLPYAAMTLHETIHYGLNTSDPVGGKEWSTLSFFPRGYGRIHLGHDRRVFNHVFWHQMHCIVSMQTAMRNRSDQYTTPGHIQHCLNYLRQTFLCEADHMLEEGDFLKRNYETDKIADVRMCRDWDMVEGFLGERIQVFFDWKHQYYPSPPSYINT